jgi:hypothetical protein
MKARDKKAVLKPVLAVLLLVTALFAIARTSQSYSEQLPLRQQSKYFDFRFKQHPEKIKAIARFADAFIDIVNRDFFEAEFDYPIRVLVTEDFATHRTLVSEQFGVTDPTMGIFLYKYNLFATYEDSGLGTFAHEIMHPLVERNLKDRPEWAIEGILAPPTKRRTAGRSSVSQIRGVIRHFCHERIKATAKALSDRGAAALA